MKQHLIFSGFCTFLFYSLITPPAFALIPFFFGIDSEFPSGSSEKNRLSKNIIESFSESAQLVKINGTEYWVKEDESIHYRNLAKNLNCKEKLPFYNSRNSGAQTISFCQQDQQLRILGFQNDRFRVRTKAGRIYWVDADDLYWPMDELGKAYFPEGSYIQSLDKRADRLWIAKDKKLDILFYKGDQVFLALGNKTYSAPHAKLITPVKLASHLRLKGGKWQAYHLAANKLVYGGKSYSLPFKPILKFEKEISFLKAGQKLFQFFDSKLKEVSKLTGARIVRVIQSKKLYWHSSKMKGHGLVYWQESLRTKTKQQPISSNDFLNRTLFDMAASPKDPKLIFASAEGVFRKDTKNQWIPLANFGKQNLPIHFSKSGRLFIGAFYSDDQGESFTPYLSLKKLLLKEKSLSLKAIKVLEIESLDDNGHKIKALLKQGEKELSLSIDLRTGDFKKYQ